MAYSLNNVTPPDSFSDVDAVLKCPNSRAITVQVYNQAVYYQLAIGRAGVSSTVGSEIWEPDGGVFLGPGYWNFDVGDFYGGVAHAIRFRQAVAGATDDAIVTASA